MNFLLCLMLVLLLAKTFKFQTLTSYSFTPSNISTIVSLVLLGFIWIAWDNAHNFLDIVSNIDLPIGWSAVKHFKVGVGGIGEVVHLKNLPFLHLHLHFDPVKHCNKHLLPLWMLLGILTMGGYPHVCDFLHQVCLLFMLSPLSIMVGLVNC